MLFLISKYNKAVQTGVSDMFIMLREYVNINPGPMTRYGVVEINEHSLGVAQNRKKRELAKIF